MTPSIPAPWRWFPEGRFGLFIHWGAYAEHGLGEQVLFREHLDQSDYARRACAWDPRNADIARWARTARRIGVRYAVLTARHHDGYCLWASRLTDYTSARQAPRRDFLREYCDAFRAQGIRVGIYYSLADWRIPAYWDGPAADPRGWEAFRGYVHGQVSEILTGYGKVDLLWFDGAWPHSAEVWGSRELLGTIRRLQPGILVNNRLGALEHPTGPSADGGQGAGESAELGDFGTPEHHITAEASRLWESCQVSVWRLWGYARGERWRPADLLLDMLVESASKGGNLLLNVGPTGDGELPAEFEERAEAIGDWLSVHGEAVYGTEAGGVTEFVTRGWQTRKGNLLYLIFRFWDGSGCLTLPGLETRVKRATLLSTGADLAVEQETDRLRIVGLPIQRPTPLFPVIRLECDGEPRPRSWAAERLWAGDPRRMTPWAAARGTSVWADGKPR